MDVDKLKAGQRFDQELANALDQCDVLLAIIGPRWLDILGERQTANARDYVRDEIAAALERDAIVIPVLVEDARLPMAASLPPELRKLLLYQAHQITHTRFGRDVADLVEAIKQSRRARQGRGPSGSALRWTPVAWMALIVLAAAATVLATTLLRSSNQSVDQIGSTVGVPGRYFRDCPNLCPDLIVVPAETFTMGSLSGEANETPPRAVTITRPFAVARFEVTFAEWDACIAAAGCSHKPETDWGRDQKPVVSVSWEDAKTYVAWLSRITGKNYRLLSEAEWEHAARAQTTSSYAFGDKLTADQAHYMADGGPSPFGTTVNVGTFKPNTFGLYDLHGNAAEWVEDCYHENYKQAPADAGAWLEPNCTRRVVRGGSWRDNAHDLRSSSRRGVKAVDRYNFIGFRVARTL